MRNRKTTTTSEPADPIKQAFDSLKPPNKMTVDVRSVLDTVKENPRLQNRYPLAYQFLDKFVTDDLLGGVEYEAFKEDMDNYFTPEESEDGEEDEPPAQLEFEELAEKLSLFDTPEKLEALWSELNLHTHFTEECKNFVISNLLSKQTETDLNQPN